MEQSVSATRQAILEKTTTPDNPRTTEVIKRGMLYTLAIIGLISSSRLLDITVPDRRKAVRTNEGSVVNVQQSASVGRQTNVEKATTTDTARTSAIDKENLFKFLVRVINRGMLYALAIIGVISAGCLSGLPSTTCYALADAYTIALQNIGACIIPAGFGFAVLSIANWPIQQGDVPKVLSSKSTTITLCIAGILLILVFLYLISFLGGYGIANVRLAIDHCLEDTTTHKHNLNDRILLYRNLFTNTRS